MKFSFSTIEISFEIKFFKKKIFEDNFSILTYNIIWIQDYFDYQYRKIDYRQLESENVYDSGVFVFLVMIKYDVIVGEILLGTQ